MQNRRHRGVEGQTALDRLIDDCLERIQDELPADQSKMVVAINLATGEYVLGKEYPEALSEYKKRWPNGGYYICRVDGSAAIRM